MDHALRDLVRRRAAERCEYCRLPQEAEPLFPFHIEHVVPKQHRGSNDADNLALACHHCNLHKGPNLAGLEPETGGLVPLFHPRRDVWREHFEFHRGEIVGLTPTGRATVHVLQLNAPGRVELREEWLKSRSID
jgi:HNH endonuclease